jgi:hypothetical protein
MHQVSFNISDNWDEHPELQRSVEWQTASGGERCIMFEAAVDAHPWSIRLNDFPEEPCFSVLVDGAEVLRFDDWPRFWGTMPQFPRRD